MTTHNITNYPALAASINTTGTYVPYPSTGMGMGMGTGTGWPYYDPYGVLQPGIYSPNTVFDSVSKEELLKLRETVFESKYGSVFRIDLPKPQYIEISTMLLDLTPGGQMEVHKIPGDDFTLQLLFSREEDAVAIKTKIGR